MGGSASKILFCCLPAKQKSSKLEKGIIENQDARSEYSQILMNDFDIKGRSFRKSALGNGFNHKNNSDSLDFKEVDFLKDCSSVKVFEIEHRSTQQRLLLTRISKSSLSDVEFEQICNEISVWSGGLIKHHPLLVNLYWSWQDDQFIYRIDDYIKDNDNSSDDDNSFKRFAAELALVIHYLHSHGLVHGNIGPQSIASTNPLKLSGFHWIRRVPSDGSRLRGNCGDDPEFAFRTGDEDGGLYYEEIDWYSYGRTLRFYYGKRGGRFLLKGSPLNDLIDDLEGGRIGYGPAAFKSIRSHPFFINFPWSNLFNRPASTTSLTDFNRLSASVESLKHADSISSSREHGCYLEYKIGQVDDSGDFLENIIIKT